MNISINKTKSTTFVLLLLLSLSAVFVVLPSTAAHDPAWNVPTYAFIQVSPDPVGVNQPAAIIMWIDKTPPTAAGVGGDRWTGYTVEITKPDGTKETKGPFMSWAESTYATIYTPTQTGTYTFLFKFPGQVASLTHPTTGIPGTPSAQVGDNYLASQATTTLTVQTDAIAPVPDYPLPTSYWTRPIEGQNTNWGAIASNYLGSPQIANLVQPSGAAPSSAHVMWTKEYLFGGVTGGNYAVSSGTTYYTTLSYETQFGTALIVNGRLFYQLPHSTGSGSMTVCVDLQTGDELYRVSGAMPSFGQLYDYESMNQHGVIPNGYLWKTDANPFAAFMGLPAMPQTWSAYDPMDGTWLFNLTGVPSGASASSFFGGGTMTYGPNGEILYYDLNVMGNYLALWNNTAAQGETGAMPGSTGSDAYQWRPVGKSIDASKAYSWNVTLSQQLPFGASINYIAYNDFIIGSAGFSPTASMFGGYGSPDPRTVFVVSLKPESRGQVLWIKNYAAPAGNLTRTMGPVDVVNRVFTMTDKETMQWLGYSIDNGNLLWGPVGQTNAAQYFGSPMFPGQSGYTYMGNLYCTGYGGVLYCYDTLTGNLKWTYGNGGIGNSTDSGLDTPWGDYPVFPCGFADGKVYLYTTEHSPNVPPYKGARVRCVDANTGTELWTIMSWSSSAFAIADGYATYLNVYDHQIYTIGKGPSELTVEAPLSGLTVGQSMIIQGQVSDVCAGAKAKVASGEFNVVPAMSDASQGEWMEYIYMQKPMPTDATGVPVSIFATDANGNTEQIATVTSDSSGLFHYKWMPSQEGEYVITAVFDGSNSYWGSSATTAVAVDQAVPSQTSTPTQTETPATTEAPMETTTPTPVVEPGDLFTTETLLIAGAAVIIIVAVIAAALILRKRQ